MKIGIIGSMEKEIKFLKKNIKVKKKKFMIIYFI